MWVYTQADMSPWGCHPLRTCPHAGTLWTMRISIVNSKGGVGKSTSTIYIGCALAAHGTVRVIDLDRQGTATEWAEMCIENGTPLPFPVDIGNEASLRRLEETADYTILDTPPGDPSIVDAALRAADLVIVPAAPSKPDMARVWRTLEIAAPMARTYVLFTAVDRRSKDVQYARADLEAEGAGYFENDIPFRTSISNAMGTVPTRLCNYDRVVEEILEVG